MKHLVAIGGLFLALTAGAVAGLDIPRSVYTMGDLEEAKSEAAESGKPLVFVYTDPGTT